MTSEIEALARRAVACPAWRWIPGVAAVMPDGNRARLLMEGKWWCPPLSAHEAFVDEAETLPDLTDPATLGCLLALVREAWGVPNAFAYPCAHGGWGVSLNPGWINGPTEAEALVAALEAAPAQVAQ